MKASKKGKTSAGKAVPPEAKSGTKRPVAKPVGARLYAFPLAEKISMVREGIVKAQLTALKDEIEIDYDQMAEMLVASRSSLITKKKSQRFNRVVSERFLLINDIVEYGHKIFGDNAAFNQWLKSPSEALGNATPLSMLDTFYGMDEVKKEIGRIAHGIY